MPIWVIGFDDGDDRCARATGVAGLAGGIEREVIKLVGGAVVVSMGAERVGTRTGFPGIGEALAVGVAL